MSEIEIKNESSIILVDVVCDYCGASLIAEVRLIRFSCDQLRVEPCENCCINNEEAKQ